LAVGEPPGVFGAARVAAVIPVRGGGAAEGAARDNILSLEPLPPHASTLRAPADNSKASADDTSGDKMPRPIRSAYSIPYGAAFGAMRAGGARRHNGTDYHCPVGTPIYGTADAGRALHIGYNGDPTLGMPR